MHIYAIELHVSEKQGGTVLYYRQYHLGSSRLVTDSSENRAWTRNYEPYSPLSGGSTAERWLYAGKSLDSLTGLYYFGARYYDPSIGRFIAEDPLSGASWIRRALTGTCTAGTTHTSTQTQTDTG